jgi:hypothetical protein
MARAEEKAGEAHVRRVDHDDVPVTIKDYRAERLLLFENQLQRSAHLRHLWVIQAGFAI